MATNAPTYQLLVGGKDYSNLLEQDTWTVTQNYGRQGTTARFQLFDDWSALTPSVPAVPFIKPLSEIIFTDTSIGQVLFAGYVTTPNINTFSPTCNEWLLDCIDYTLRADNIIVFDDLYNLSADKMIVQLNKDAAAANLSAASTASGGKVAPGPILGRMQFPYVTLSSALSKIARLSSQQTDYSWFIDYSRNINFFSLAQAPAPTVTFTDFASELGTGGSGATVTYGANTLTDTSQSWKVNQWAGSSVTVVVASVSYTVAVASNSTNSLTLVSPTWPVTPSAGTTYGISAISASLGDFSAATGAFAYVWDGGSLRNSCIVRGSNLSNKVTDTFVGNSNTTTWPLSYIVDSSVSNPLLTISGVRVACTVVTQGAQYTTNSSNEWVITQNAIGTWVLTPARGTPTAHAGQIIKLTYLSTTPIITRQDNKVSQAIYNDSKGNGVYQSYISDPTLTTLSSAAARGQGELQEFQWIQERVQLQTNAHWPGHINAGSTFYLHAARVPNSQANYSLGINPNQNATFLVVQNHISGKQGGWRTYGITATRIS